MKKLIIVVILFLSGISYNGFSQTAGFTIDVSSGCAPRCCNFQDQSTNALSWNWDFGDTSQGSTQQNPYHCYINPGVYKLR